MDSMFNKRIVPQYKIMISYDINAPHQDEYYRYVMGEFVPKVQEMGIYMIQAWHTAYGPYPLRLIEFVSEDYDTLLDAVDSEEFHRLEEDLMEYVTNYSRRIVSFKHGFQI